MRLLATLACAVAVAGMLGCGTKSTRVEPAVPTVSSALASVSVNTTPATFHPEDMPTGPADAPVVAGSDSFVVGSSAILAITVPDTTTSLLVGVNSLGGYLSIPITAPLRATAALRAEKLSRLGAPLTRVQQVAVRALIVVVKPLAGSHTRLRLVMAVTGPHSISQPTEFEIHPVMTGASAGQLLVSLDWSAPVDLDLHVQVPSGEDIFYGNPNPGVGGVLEFDSNAGCVIDDIDSENIAWGANVPATGRYIVRVDYNSRCGVGAQVPYVLTVRRCGVTTRYTGSMVSAEVDGGGAYAGKVVATLDIAPCGGEPALAVRPGGSPPR